jgi:hypothetical protein
MMEAKRETGKVQVTVHGNDTRLWAPSGLFLAVACFWFLVHSFLPFLA